MGILKHYLMSLGLMMIAFQALANKDCFILSQDGHILYQEGNCAKRYPPCSTFKVALSVMGFDSGILVDESHPRWPYQSHYVDWLEKWKQPHDPKLWLENSCVWYSQLLTQKMGMARFTEYTQKLNYGNQDVSGDKGKNNGLTHCWLSSSLAISPLEQKHFLEKLLEEKLPVSQISQSMTKKIMYIETLPQGWELYGKTGSGYQLSDSGEKCRDRQVGWFVGFLTKGDRRVTFVKLIADEKKFEQYASLRAKSWTIQHILPILEKVS